MVIDDIWIIKYTGVENPIKGIDTYSIHTVPPLRLEMEKPDKGNGCSVLYSACVPVV